MENKTHSIGNYRWTICALVFFATTINYLDRAGDQPAKIRPHQRIFRGTTVTMPTLK